MLYTYSTQGHISEEDVPTVVWTRLTRSRSTSSQDAEGSEGANVSLIPFECNILITCSSSS
jgi:hypothetical protein